jgi:purine-binding chemotaxis protein CheW
MTTKSDHSSPSSASDNAVRPNAPGASVAGQFTSFRIGNEEYAIDIMSVREIKGWTETTVLPNQPKFVLGVLNLRGTIVPIFDLRCRFGLGLTKATPTHVIIIATLHERTIGLLVDAVSDILTVMPDQIRPVPEIDRGASAEFMSGIINVNDSMVVILSLEKLFGRNAVSAVEEMAA